MLATDLPATQPTRHQKPGFRIPLQPKNIFTQITKSPQKCQIKPPIPILSIDKENFWGLSNPVESIDASLAEELSAVRQKMERLRLDKEKTEKLLEEREKWLDFQLYELEERGEFQRELEMEVDRLFRLNQLKLASMLKMSPIPSLREKEMQKKNNKEGHLESATSEESKLEWVGGRSITESSSLSLESAWASPSTSTSNSNDSVKNVTTFTKFDLRNFVS